MMNSEELMRRMLYDEVKEGIEFDFLNNLINTLIVMDNKLQKFNNKLDENKRDKNETD